MYMNYDMVGSPNYIQMVYDAEPVLVPAAGRGADPGRLAGDRGLVRAVLHGDRTSRTTTPSSPAGATIRRSSLNGIPSGGLFTGAEVLKTAEQQAIWGGTTGAAVRPVLPPRVRHVPNFNAARARGEQRPDRSRRADVRLLDRVGERRPRAKPVPGESKVKLPTPAGPRGTFVP